MQIQKKTSTSIILENATHTFRIKEDKLKNLLNSGELPKLEKAIQKSMKQIVDNCSGDIWEESVKEIYNLLKSDEFRQKLSEETD